MKEITAYKCDFCSKKYERKSAAITHEEKCLKRPENVVICHGCNFIQDREVQHTTFDHNGSDYQSPVKVFYCPKIVSYIYPPYINNPYLAENLGEGDLDNVVMKTECGHYQDKERL